MTTPGETTGDILALGEQHPAEQGIRPKDREGCIQRFGTLAFRWGAGICAITVTAALAGWILTENHRHLSSGSLVLIAIAGVAAASLGAGLVIVGGVERLNRGQRALSRGAILRADGLAADIVANREKIAQLDSALTDLGFTVRSHLNAVMPLVKLLDAVPRQFDDLGKSLEEIARHLPDALHRAQWQGFNEAVKEGLVEANGTDDAARRRPNHLGLVPLKEPGEPS